MITLDSFRTVKTIVCHENPDGTPCPDGMASAILLADALPGRKVVFTAYGSRLRSIPVEEGVLFADICPEETEAPAWVRAGAIVLDHHESRRHVVASFGARGVFGENEKLEAGAMLAYQHVWLPVHEGESGTSGTVEAWRENAHRFAHLAAVRDTWQTGHPDWSAACEQSAALAFYDWDTFGKIKDPFGPNRFWPPGARSRACEGREMMGNLDPHTPPDGGGVDLSALLRVGPHLVKKRAAHIAKLAADLQGTREPLRNGKMLLMVNVFSSADASELADAVEGVDIIAGYRVLPNDKLLVSLRSRSVEDPMTQAASVRVDMIGAPRCESVIEQAAAAVPERPRLRDKMLAEASALRSRSKIERGESIDVSLIAACYGGGGHPGAAGFSILCDGHPEDVILKALDNAFKKLKRA